MTFVHLPKRERDRVGLEPVFNFYWHPLKNKTHIISDFLPTSQQQMQQAKKDFIAVGKSSWDSHRAWNKELLLQ